MLLMLTLSASSRFDFSNSNYNYDNTNTNVSSHLCKEFSGVNLADSAKKQDQNGSIGKK
jgi:hypothetical protein